MSTFPSHPAPTATDRADRRTTLARALRRACAAVLVVAAAAALDTSSAAGATTQRVRIEGRTSTLFEGGILTQGRTIKATSDTEARRCDSTNNGAHPTAAATPTAAAVDALSSVGQGFDGEWYPGFDDYFVQQLGPDREDAGAFAYWGVLVNGIYTSVGGCQYALSPGDLALWVYDAFSMRNLLRLDGPSGPGEPTADAEGAAPTAPAQQSYTVGLGQPFVVTTVENQATGDTGAAGYRRPVAGVVVAPVQTAADGAQTVLTADPTAVTSDASGHATLTWSTPGWKRIKADQAGFVRSNRLDVCVMDALGGGCGADGLPPDTGVVTPPPNTLPKPPSTPSGSGSLAIGPPARSNPTPVGTETTVRGLRLTTDGNATGLIGVRWQVLGSPLKRWRIEYRQRGVASRAWHAATTGTVQTSALLDLPVGRFVDLRVRFEPTVGAATVRSLGTVAVPVDDRLRQVAFTGPVTRARDPLAWRQTVTRMRAGARLTTTLRPGRPTLIVRSDRRSAQIEVTVGNGRPQRLTVPGHADGRTVFVSGRAGAGGATKVRVRSGVVRVDAVVARS